MTDDPVTLLAVCGRTPIIDPSVFIAAGASVIGSVEIGPRVGVWYGAVLRADTERIVVGPDTNLQDGVIVHSDPGLPAVLGARTTVGHGAVLHGATIGDGCLIGMRATVMNGARVGAGSLVAAGAVITEGREIPPGSLVAGLPATVRREVTEDETTRIAEAWQEYVQHAKQHARARRATADEVLRA